MKAQPTPIGQQASAVEERLSGIVERVTYHDPQSGFCVVKVRVSGHRDLVTVVGHATAVMPGEQLTARGRWAIDRQHGRQFKAHELSMSPPTSVAGILRYLESGAIRSIGPKLAARIVTLYQERSLEILEQHSDLLLHIRGIGHERLKRIRQSWREQEGVRRVMMFLYEHGIGSARALQIYRAYGEAAVSTIREDPYRLADEIRGIGFKTADALASRLGIPKDSPARARAALKYVLQQLADEGHTGYPQDEVIDRTVELTEIERPMVTAAAETSVAQGLLQRESLRTGICLYLTPLYRAEVGLARAVARLVASAGHPLPAIDVEVAIDWVQKKLGMVLAETQREAVRQVCRHKLMIITGGPGVGKTTLVRSIIEIFEAKGLSSVLTAPTGRAAKRLTETTGRAAMTVHRRLEFDPARGVPRRDEQNPMEGDLFVLDEASMADVVLSNQFLRAVPREACVILVGDIDQLPSVGPGSVLADLIRSRTLPVVRLTEIFRQAAESRIVTAAAEIRAGRMPQSDPADPKCDFYVVPAETPEATVDLIIRMVCERIPQRFGWNPLTDIQVLTPMNRYDLGTHNLNRVLQQALNPSRGQEEIESFGHPLRVGDRVIQLVNNYSREVFNGDLGAVQSINRVEQQLTVAYDGRPVEYDFGDLDEISLAYAMSVHKSQGSEYPCVVLPLTTQHFVLLRRNLFYTAVTRGKKLVVVVGSKRAMAMAVKRQDTTSRHSALCERLVAAAGGGPLD